MRHDMNDMRRAAVIAILLSFSFPAILRAQKVRDDWKYLEHPFDLEARLDRSVADAPLAPEERARIYKLIAGKSVRDFYPGEEREAVFGARIGSIGLAEDGTMQWVLRPPRRFCGASMNCIIWIIARRNGKLKLALSASGNALMVKKSAAHGFHDISTYWHLAADQGLFHVYRWDGRKYEQTDCYTAKFDVDHPGMPPRTSDCPAGK